MLKTARRVGEAGAVAAGPEATAFIPFPSADAEANRQLRRRRFGLRTAGMGRLKLGAPSPRAASTLAPSILIAFAALRAKGPIVPRYSASNLPIMRDAQRFGFGQSAVTHG